MAYQVSVSVGYNKEYEIEADNEDEALEQAEKLAKEDLQNDELGEPLIEPEVISDDDMNEEEEDGYMGGDEENSEEEE